MAKDAGFSDGMLSTLLSSNFATFRIPSTSHLFCFGAPRRPRVVALIMPKSYSMAVNILVEFTLVAASAHLVRRNVGQWTWKLGVRVQDT